MAGLDFVGAIVGFLLTCMVLSYIFGDNPLFRFSTHLFIGVAAGYTGAVALRNVIFPNLILPLFGFFAGDFSLSQLLALIPVILSLMLLTKLSPRLGRIGNGAMAYLVGVGAAIAIGGTVVGTLFPQTQATINAYDFATITYDNPAAFLLEFFSRTLSILGTVFTLLYFHFSTLQKTDAPASRPAWLEGVAQIGQVFIAITFGVVFAGVYAAALTALIERLNALIDYIFTMLNFFGLS